MPHLHGACGLPSGNAGCLARRGVWAAGAVKADDLVLISCAWPRKLGTHATLLVLCACLWRVRSGAVWCRACGGLWALAVPVGHTRRPALLRAGARGSGLGMWGRALTCWRMGVRLACDCALWARTVGRAICGRRAVSRYDCEYGVCLSLVRRRLVCAE